MVFQVDHERFQTDIWRRQKVDCSVDLFWISLEDLFFSSHMFRDESLLENS